MSKAFTRETDDLDEVFDEAPDPELPDGVTNYVTPAGAARLRAELERLIDRDRPALAPVAAGGSTDDLRRLRELDRRIRLLSRRLGAAEVVDPTAQPADRVRFGATVTVRDDEGATRTWRVVGVDEVDAGHGHISWRSPLATALLGAAVGDVVTLRAPRERGGETELEVVAIRYEG